MLVVGILIAGFLTGCSRGEGEQPPASGQDAGPLEISVCMDVPGEKEVPESLLWEGMHNAHGLRDTLEGRKIELVPKEPGARTFDSLEAIAAYVREEEIDGPILFRSSREFGPDGEFSRDSGTFITVMPSARCLAQAGKECIAVQVGSSLKDRARTAALFARNTLKADDAMIVLDQDAPGSVLLASRFSSEMIRLGGSVAELCILSGEHADVEDALNLVKQKNPGVVYIPYSDNTTIRTIELLRRQNFNSPVLVVNVAQERSFLAQGAEGLEGVYLITDARPRSTRWQRTLRGVRRIAGLPENPVSHEPLAALGADAYEILIDLLQDGVRSEPSREVRTPFEGGEDHPGNTRPRHPDTRRGSMHVCRVETGVLQGPHLVFLETIDP